MNFRNTKQQTTNPDICKRGISSFKEYLTRNPRLESQVLLFHILPLIQKLMDTHNARINKMHFYEKSEIMKCKLNKID